MLKRLRCVVLLLLYGVVVLAVSQATYAGSLDPILIDRGVDEPIRIAVVPFKLDPVLQDQTNTADIVAFDLARSGQFAPLESENMLSYPTSRKEVFFRDWRILNAVYLVIGSAASTADGRVKLSFELFDVVGERRMDGRTYTASLSQWRQVAHQMADSIYAEITGIRGAFATKILYVLAQNSGTPDATYRLEVADSDGEQSKTLLNSREPILSASLGT